jgi:hypothetical protein
MNACHAARRTYGGQAAGGRVRRSQAQEGMPAVIEMAADMRSHALAAGHFGASRVDSLLGSHASPP